MRAGASIDASDQLARYFGAVYDPADVVELRCLRGDDARSEWCIACDLPGLADGMASMKADGWNIYAGVQPRIDWQCKGDNSVKIARCVFADFDGADADEVSVRIFNARLPQPTMVIGSGHGMHVYWRLLLPLEDVGQHTEFQRDIAVMLGSDPKVFNPERIMRLPGFLNLKKEPYVYCEIIECDCTRRIDFEKLRSIVPCRPKPIIPKPVNPQSLTTDISERDRLERCRKYIAKLPDAISGQGGHNQTFEYACIIHRFNLSHGTGWNYLLDLNASKCSPPWNEKELRHKFDDAYKRVGADGEIGVMLRNPTPQRPINGNGKHYSQPVKVTGEADISENYKSFPVDALPTVMQQFATELGRTLCVDPVMAVLPMLSIAGAAIGNSVRAKMSDDYHAPPNVWTAAVVRSGERKSPVLRAVMQPIYAKQAEAASKHASEVAAYAQDLERWKAKPKSERGDSPLEPGPYPHFYLSDTTAEAIALRLLAQPRGLADVLDELGALFRSFNQYKNGKGNDRESYLAFYDAGAAKIDRKSATPPTIFIPRAFVAVTGMIQPAALAQAFGPMEYDSGLAARFLLAAPPPMQATWMDQGMTKEVREGWSGLLASLLKTELQSEPTLIPPSDSAMTLWARAHDSMEIERHAERDDRMRAARAKLIGVIPRLSLILQCVSAASGEGHSLVKCIDETSMERAIKIAEWCGSETRRVYRLLAGAGSENDIIRRIEANGGTVTTRELMHWSREFRSSVRTAEDYLDSLAGDGIGKWEWDPQHGKGRPRRVFRLSDSGNGNKNTPDDHGNRDCVTVTGQVSENGK